MSLDAVERIAEVLEMPVADLLGDIGRWPADSGLESNAA